MQVNPKIAGDAINAFKQNTSDKKNQNLQAEEKSIEQTINDSAVAVKLSMNAQIVLFSMNTSELTEKNTIIQGALSGSEEILEFLSGKTTSSGMSLSNIGYEGKPITELSVDEANELLSDDGFFGIEQTSDRVANFVFNFAGDDLDK